MGRNRAPLLWVQPRRGPAHNGITQRLEDQVRVYRVAPRYQSHGNARCRREEVDRTLLFIRPKSLHSTRHTIAVVSTSDGGHYPLLQSRGKAVSPDAFA
jgi:hypothetical protein